MRSARSSRAVSGVLGNFKKRTGKIQRGKGEAVRKQNRIRFAASADTRLKYAGRCAWRPFCPRGRRCRRVVVLEMLLQGCSESQNLLLSNSPSGAELQSGVRGVDLPLL